MNASQDHQVQVGKFTFKGIYFPKEKVLIILEPPIEILKPKEEPLRHLGAFPGESLEECEAQSKTGIEQWLKQRNLPTS